MGFLSETLSFEKKKKKRKKKKKKRLTLLAEGSGCTFKPILRHSSRRLINVMWNLAGSVLSRWIFQAITYPLTDEEGIHRRAGWVGRLKITRSMGWAWDNQDSRFKCHRRFCFVPHYLSFGHPRFTILLSTVAQWVHASQLPLLMTLQKETANFIEKQRNNSKKCVQAFFFLLNPVAT